MTSCPTNLVTDDRQLADAVSDEMDRQVALLPRKNCKAAMDNEGFVQLWKILTMHYINECRGSEHLEVQLPDAIEYLTKLRMPDQSFLAGIRTAG